MNPEKRAALARIEIKIQDLITEAIQITGKDVLGVEIRTKENPYYRQRYFPLEVRLHFKEPEDGNTGKVRGRSGKNR